MKRILVTFLAAIVLTACGTTSPNSFLTDAAQGGNAEVQLGTLAMKSTQNPDIRAFALMMVDDHSKANSELKTVADKKSVELPKDISSSQKSNYERLSKLTGAEFDKEYVKAMVEDHEKDVKAFQTQAETGTDAEVKAFAAKTLPTLQMHLQRINEIKAKMQKGE